MESISFFSEEALLERLGVSLGKLLDGSACVLVGHWFWGAHAISPRYRVPFAAKPE